MHHNMLKANKRITEILLSLLFGNVHHLLEKLTYDPWHVTFWHQSSLAIMKLHNKQPQNLKDIR